MSVEFQPLRNQVLLTLEPEPELSKVVQVQRSVEGLCRFAKVVSVGPEVRHVQKGGRVLASITAGVETVWGVVVSEPAILAHVE